MPSGAVAVFSFTVIAMLVGEAVHFVAPPCSSHGETVLVNLAQVAIFTVLHGYECIPCFSGATSVIRCHKSFEYRYMRVSRQYKHPASFCARGAVRHRA